MMHLHGGRGGGLNLRWGCSGRRPRSLSRSGRGEVRLLPRRRAAVLGARRRPSRGAGGDAGPGGDGGGGGRVAGDGAAGGDGAGDALPLPRCRRCTQPSFSRHWKPSFRTEPFTHSTARNERWKNKTKRRTRWRGRLPRCQTLIWLSSSQTTGQIKAEMSGIHRDEREKVSY